MANQYDVGDLVRVSATFSDENGNLADPTTVTIKYRANLGAIVTKTYVTDPEVLKDSVGNYHIDIVPTEANARYSYRWDGAGALIAAAEGYFLTRSSQF